MKEKLIKVACCVFPNGTSQWFETERYNDPQQEANRLFIQFSQEHPEYNGTGVSGAIAELTMLKKDFDNLPELADPDLDERRQAFLEKDKKHRKAALEETLRISRSGYGGVDENCRIVDRREFPKAQALLRNGYQGIPAPKDFESVWPCQDCGACDFAEAQQDCSDGMNHNRPCASRQLEQQKERG